MSSLLTNVFRIGRELGVDPTVILQSSHGRRSIDTMQLYDPSKANWGCECEPSFRACISTCVELTKA